MTNEELKKEYETQDNRATAYPIYVTVQELIPVGVIAAGHSALPEDGETRMECSKPDDCPYGDNNLDRCAGGCRYIEQVGYIWQNIEFFLTVKGAEEYIKADGHNHGKLRTYIKHFNQRNYEMNDFLREAGFKCTD